MGLLSAEMGDQSRKNSEHHILLESTNCSHLMWYYRKGLKSESYEQDWGEGACAYSFGLWFLDDYFLANGIKNYIGD